MKTALKSTKEWALVVLTLLLIPLPVVLVWMLLDGITYWSWAQAARLAGFTYGFEVVCLLGVLVKARFGHDPEDGHDAS